MHVCPRLPFRRRNLPPPRRHQSDHVQEIDALNQIRSSLSALASNSTGFSLRQPHLDRTRLCDLPDEQLDQTYVKQRDQLKQLVQVCTRTCACPW